MLACEKSEHFSDNEKNKNRQLLRILNPVVESVHSRKMENNRKFYLVRFNGKSLSNCQWVEESTLLERDPNLKNKLKRFDSTFDNTRSDSDSEAKTIGIDADCTNVDRILDSSEIFTLIHPKKASDIKTKWSESLIKVMRALINFNQNNVFYGVFYIELIDTLKHYSEFSEPIDFSTIVNRIYLDYYHSPDRFWDDLEHVFHSVSRLCLYLDEHSDVEELNDRMKQLTAILYSEWLETIKFEACVFSAKITNPTFEDIIINLRNQFRTMFEGETATPDRMIALIDESKHFLNFPEKDFDNSFQNMISDVEKLKQLSNEHVSFVDPHHANGNETPENAVISREIPQNEFEEKNHQNFQDPLINQENDHFSRSHFETIPKNFSAEIQQLMAKINEFVVQKTSFINSVMSKTYWNDFSRQIHRLSAFFKPATELDRIDWTTNLPSIHEKHEILFLVKWSNMSYAESTWEKESELLGFASKLRDYKRFTRAMDRETRKVFLNRFHHFEELRNLIENPKTLERTSNSTLNELRHKIFVYKDQKNLIQYTQKSQPVFKDQRLLRSYQLESLNWMIDAWTKRRNIILADEMGLGKTIQAMSFLNHLISFENQSGPYLVIAPLSTLSHWKRVFEDWTHLNAILYYDSKGKEGREACQNYEFTHWDITLKGLFIKDNKITKFSVLITSFEVFIQDFDSVFKNLPFQHIIIDEAHRLKNRNAKIITILKRLTCQRIFLLTGTPIQNNLSELWSLLNFIEPNVFNDLQKFLVNYEEQMKMESLQKLQEALNPFLLRRMKEEVESSIPPLMETIIDVELTSVQKIVYKTLYEKNKGTLQKGLGFSGITLMNNLEMQLRKCCNHPFTISDIGENLTKDCFSNDAYVDKLVSSSGKMIFVDKALAKFKNENKKVLIFSQFTEILRILEEYLNHNQLKYYKIDGSTKARDRQIYIDKFNSNPGVFEVFLLSTKAGGLGINLTSANIVIIFDSDWNPQNDIQAIARAHRIGQTQEVKVFRLISKKTYESEMFERASKKLGLDQAILLAGNYAAKASEGIKSEDFTKLKPEEIETLLKKGMIGLLNMTDENSNTDNQFAQNIDEIIQNARTANYSVINGLYTFGKTRFIGNEKDELLQIDDPDFWKKAFSNQKTAIENFEKEYKMLISSDKVKKIDVQKDFFLRLSEELYKYLDDRVSNEGFSADTEIKFCDLLIQITDNNSFNQVFRELASQLNADFNKSSRRIKRVDERLLNMLLKIPINNNEGGNDKQNDGNQAKSKNRQKNQAALSEELPDINQSMDESYVYENEEEKIISTHKKEKKSKQEEKFKMCDFCGKKEDLIKCLGFCGRVCHLDCLKADMARKVLKSENNGSLETRENEILETVFVNEMCHYCLSDKTFCFECKSEDNCSKEVLLQTDVLTKELNPNLVYKCSICPKFYHQKCIKPVPIKEPKEPKEAEENSENEEKKPNEFICSQHFCNTCGVFSRTVYQCVQCPFASHKKCMSKRNKVINGFKIVCVKHIIIKPPVIKEKIVKIRKTEDLEKTLKNPKIELTQIAENKEKPEKVKIRSSERRKRPDHSKSGDQPAKANGSLDRAKKIVKRDRVRPQKMDKSLVIEKEKKVEMPSGSSKRTKHSVDTNQKLNFEIIKPFDYSYYKKVN